MDDDTQAKCRAIAEFEGLELDPDVFCIRIRDAQGGHHHWASVPDYPHDLNATMRAARRLPEGVDLVVMSHGAAYIDESDDCSTGMTQSRIAFLDSDPARAAFECIYECVAAQRKEKQGELLI